MVRSGMTFIADNKSGVRAGTAASSRRVVRSDTSGVWRRKSCPQYALVMRTSAAIWDSDLPEASLAASSAATSFCLGMAADEQVVVAPSMIPQNAGQLLEQGIAPEIRPKRG